MKNNGMTVFTPAVKRIVDNAVKRLGRSFRLDSLKRSEVEANIMLYLWQNAHYYDPALSEWKTFATMVISSGFKRERVHLIQEVNQARNFIAIEMDHDDDDACGHSIHVDRSKVIDIAFAIDLADALSRMPPSSAAILSAVVVEGRSMKEAAHMFGYSPKVFYRSVWPCVQKDFLNSGGEFFRADRQ